MKVLKGIGFWLASCTWGVIITAAGLLVALALLITGHRPHRFHYFVYFEVGNGWGGFSLGGVFVVNRNASLSMKQHESGHGLQNIMLGVFMLFVISIPSAVRYWWRKYKARRGATLPPYNAVWFEAWASALGEKYFE